MRIEELVGSDVIACEFNADIRSSQTWPYLVPASRTSDVVPQPGGEAVEPVLVVGSSGNMVCSIGSGDNESEYEEYEEDGDEKCHEEEVEDEETLFVPVCADKAGEGNKEDEDSDDDDGPPEVGDALVVGLGC